MEEIKKIEMINIKIAEEEKKQIDLKFNKELNDLKLELLKNEKKNLINNFLNKLNKGE